MTTDPTTPEQDTSTTTDTDATDVAETAADAAAEGSGAPDDATAALRREAAGYRRQLRAAETERDTVAARLTALQRREAERLASERGVRVLDDGRDLWAGGVVLDNLLADDGTVDPDKVTAATKQVLTDHPAWAKRWPGVNGGARTPMPVEPSLGEVLGNVRRGR